MAKNPKMVMCRNCNTVIAANAKICPACGAKNKKPFYRRLWFIILVVIVVIGVISSGGRRGDRAEESKQTDTELDASMASQTETSREFKENLPVETPKQDSAKEEENSENSSVKEAEETEDGSSAGTPEQDAASEVEKANAEAEEAEEAKPEEVQEDDGAIDSDFKAAMDSYEAFMDEYIAFMKKYKENPGDAALLLDYTNYMSKYAQLVDDFSKWENADMNAAEVAYYAEVSARVSKKLLEVSQ